MEHELTVCSSESAALFDVAHQYLCCVPDQGTGPRVSGLHGSAGFREEAGSDHHAQEAGHSGSPEEAHKGTIQFKFFTPEVLKSLRFRPQINFKAIPKPRGRTHHYKWTFISNNSIKACKNVYSSESTG